jgi:hypothetical protein
MESTKPKRVYERIECEFDGKKYEGRFYVERGWLTLNSALAVRAQR